MALDVLSGATKTTLYVLCRVVNRCWMICPGWQNGIGCFVRGDKNSIEWFVQGGKSLLDGLSRVTKAALDVLCMLANIC